MRQFRFDKRPFYPDWGEAVNEYFKDSFSKVFVLLNPFIKVPDSYDKELEEHNIWAGDDSIDYPSEKFILDSCEEIKWKKIIEISSLNSIKEINHALITNGLKKECQNEILADTLYELCDSNSIYYPSDGDLTPFNKIKLINLLHDLKLKNIEIIPEFSDNYLHLKTSEFMKLIELDLGTATIISDDKNLLITNHWDSFMTVLATNIEINKEYLEKFEFEVIEPNDKFTLDLR